MKINELKVGKIYKTDSYIKYRLTEKGYLEYKKSIIWDKPNLTYNEVVKMNFTEVLQNKRWRAEYKGIYFYLDSSGDIFRDFDARTNTNNYRYKIGNYARTGKQLKNYREKLLVIQEVKDWANEYNDVIDWKDTEQEKYYWYYNYDNKKMYIYYRYHSKIDEPAFSSEKLAEECWSIYGERWLKYVWEIKE